jgi:hypothetical protein
VIFLGEKKQGGKNDRVDHLQPRVGSVRGFRLVLGVLTAAEAVGIPADLIARPVRYENFLERSSTLVELGDEIS